MKQRVIASIIAAASIIGAVACTSAIVSGRLTKDGRPLLWKNRDTGITDNFIARVTPKEGDYAYIGLFNAGDSTLSEAWMGMNEAGFAIMNTASYNLAPDTAKFADQEGRVMAIALQRCRNLDDFERLLDSLPKPIGVQANFGAIDAEGRGAYYETDDYSYTKYSIDEEPSGILIRTNYSMSGTYPTGKGYIRYDNANHLLTGPIENHDISPATFTDGLSRSFYHSLRNKDMGKSKERWVIDQDFIPRHSTSASIVIEGVNPGEDPSGIIMWAAMGYPPVAHTLKVTLDSVPTELLPDARWHSPECDAAAKRKSMVFPLKRGNGPRYIDLPQLLKIDTEQRRLSQAK